MASDKEIDSVGVRKRAIDRRLRAVESLPESETNELLRIADLSVPDESRRRRRWSDDRGALSA